MTSTFGPETRVRLSFVATLARQSRCTASSFERQLERKETFAQLKQSYFLSCKVRTHSGVTDDCLTSTSCRLSKESPCRDAVPVTTDLRKRARRLVQVFAGQFRDIRTGILMEHYFAGICVGVPLSFTKNATNFAGSVLLALRPITWTSLGLS